MTREGITCCSGFFRPTRIYTQWTGSLEADFKKPQFQSSFRIGKGGRRKDYAFCFRRRSLFQAAHSPAAAREKTSPTGITRDRGSISVSSRVMTAMV